MQMHGSQWQPMVSPFPTHGRFSKMSISRVGSKTIAARVAWLQSVRFEGCRGGEYNQRQVRKGLPYCLVTTKFPVPTKRFYQSSMQRCSTYSLCWFHLFSICS